MWILLVLTTSVWMVQSIQQNIGLPNQIVWQPPHIFLFFQIAKQDFYIFITFLFLFFSGFWVPYWYFCYNRAASSMWPSHTHWKNWSYKFIWFWCVTTFGCLLQHSLGLYFGWEFSWRRQQSLDNVRFGRSFIPTIARSFKFIWYPK